MCAIFGVGFLKGHRVEDSEMVRNIIRNLFIENQVRGRTAAGLACVTSAEIHVVKKNVQGDRLIKLPEYEAMERKYMFFGTKAGKDPAGIAREPTMSFIGHCRLRTKGTELDNANNHPIVREDVVGVHNGMIGNDDRLFEVYSKTFDRNGRVDSEIIFALMEYYSRNEVRPVHEAIQKMTQATSGGQACAAAHRRHPHVVWLWRRGGPCDVVIFRDVGMVVWSSMQTYIMNATRPYKDVLGEPDVIDFDGGEGLGIDLFRNYIHRYEVFNYKATAVREA